MVPPIPGLNVNSANRHMDYDRERHADFVRAARRSELASAVATARDAERRSFLARAWAKRFGRSSAPPDAVPETAPIVTS